MLKKIFKKRTIEDVYRDIDLGADWVSNAMTQSGYKADFSLESLKEIDRFFDDNSKNGKPTPGGILSEDIGMRMFSIWAYVGEVLKRNIGGEWWGDIKDFMVKVNVELRLENGSTIWPMQKVGKRLANGPEDSIFDYGMWLNKEGS